MLYITTFVSDWLWNPNWSEKIWRAADMSLFIFEVINRQAEVCKFYMAIFDKNVSKFYITVLLKDS